MEDLFSHDKLDDLPVAGSLFDMAPPRLFAYIQFIFTVYLRSYLADDGSIQAAEGHITGKDTVQTKDLLFVDEGIIMMAVTHIQRRNERNRFYLLKPQQNLYHRYSPTFLRVFVVITMLIAFLRKIIVYT